MLVRYVFCLSGDARIDNRYLKEDGPLISSRNTLMSRKYRITSRGPFKVKQPRPRSSARVSSLVSWNSTRTSRAFPRFLTDHPRCKCLIGHGVFDGLSTHIASQTALTSSIAGSGVSRGGGGGGGGYCGESDLSVIMQTEMTEVRMMVAEHTPLPVMADADTGFCGPVSSPHLIRCYVQYFQSDDGLRPC